MHQSQSLRTFLPSAALPRFAAGCEEHAIALQKATSSMTQLWPLVDRALVLLLPTLADDVARFHAVGGQSITEIFQIHQLEHMDQQLAEDLTIRLAALARPSTASTPGIKLRQASGMPLPNEWHSALSAVTFIAVSHLTEGSVADQLHLFRRSLTLLLSPPSQQRVVKAIASLTGSEPETARVAQTELAAAASCWHDILRLPPGDLAARAEMTLLLHFARALKLIRPAVADLHLSDRKALVELAGLVQLLGSQPSVA